MNALKRLLVLAAVAAMVLSAYGCDGATDGTNDGNGTNQPPVTDTVKAQVRVKIWDHSRIATVPGATLSIPSLDLACHADLAGICDLGDAVPYGNHPFSVACPEHELFTGMLNVDAPIVEHDVELAPSSEILVLEGYTATYISTLSSHPENTVITDVTVTYDVAEGMINFTYYEPEYEREINLGWVWEGCTTMGGGKLDCSWVTNSGATRSYSGNFKEDLTSFTIVSDSYPEDITLTITKN